MNAQNNVGIGTNTPAASAKLDINASDKGMMIPQVALTATNAASPITSPATSLMVYNTATAGTAPNNVTPGYYYNAGTPASPNWVRLTTNKSTEVDWTVANTSSTPAVKADNQYVTGNVGIGDFSGTTPLGVFQTKRGSNGNDFTNTQTTNSDLIISGLANAAPARMLLGTNNSTGGTTTGNQIEFWANSFGGGMGKLGQISTSSTQGASAGQTYGNLLFSTSNNDAAGTVTEKMRIDPSGDVGIGNNAPTIKLHVNGGLATTPSTAAAAAAITVPSNVSSFYITNVAAGSTSVLTQPATSVEGQYLTIVNLDDNAATFAGASIPATTGVGEFQYINTAWRIMGISSGTNNNWTVANTTSTPAVKADNQYVTGKVGIGDFSTSTLSNAPFEVKYAGTGASSNWDPQTMGIYLNDTRSYTANVGGGIGFAGKYKSDGSYSGFSSIWGAKENVTDNDYAGYLGFATRVNGAYVLERMRISSAGNVGIGTTSPSAPLHVVKSGAADQYVARFTQTNTTTGNSTFIGLGSENASTSKASIGFQRTDAFDKGDITFNVVNNNTSLVDAAESDERMRIRSDGNVGIGTTAPSTKLHVQTGANSTAATFDGCNASDGTAVVSIRRQDVTARKIDIIPSGYDGTNTYQQINFSSSSITGTHSTRFTNGLRYTFDGNVGIGTTSPQGLLSIAHGQGDGAATNAHGIYFQNTGGWGYASIYAQGTTGYNGTLVFATDRDATNNNNPTVRMQLSGGNGSNNATYDGDSNWDFASDKRIKREIDTAESMLDKVMHLSISRFFYKKDPNKKYKELGVIAQNVEQYFPDLITYNSNPNYPELGDSCRYVAYTSFGVVAIKAIQEQQKEIEDFKSEIVLLKKQNGELKTENTNIKETKSDKSEVEQLKAQIDELKKLVVNLGLKAEK